MSSRPGVDRAVGRAWRRLAVAFGCWLAGDLIWFVYEVGLRQTPFPSPADVAYLAFYPCAARALLSFPSAARRRSDWMKMGLDALTVLLCAAMGIWYLVIGPTVHDNPADQGVLAMVLNLAYPVGDLLVLFGVAREPDAPDHGHGRRLPDPRRRRRCAGGRRRGLRPPLAVRRPTRAAASPTPSGRAAWCLFFLAARAAPAAAEGPAPRRRPSGHGRARPPTPRRAEQPLARLPYLAVALAYGLLLFVGRRAAVYPLDGLILGVAAITARRARSARSA